MKVVGKKAFSEMSALALAAIEQPVIVRSYDEPLGVWVPWSQWDAIAASARKDTKAEEEE